MWADTQIEKKLKSELHSCYNEQEAETYYAMYKTAKDYLCQNIYAEIKGKEPTLTDHSERHIKNVLEMAWNLIADEKGEHNFNVIEIYLLCTCILFHDVGNIHGREGHNSKVADIYNSIRGNNAFCKLERPLVLRVVKAHCGESRRGDKDTLLDVDITTHLYNKQVRLREIAAILRLADELAEGPQRTSQYMIDNGMISNASIIYHKYASVTQIHVDRGNGRIVLTYVIDYPVEEISFKDLMLFTYKRILKLDTERRYCKYYAPSLDVFKRTEASVSFIVLGDICDCDLPKICLEDKYSLVEEDIDGLIKSVKGLDDIDTLDKKLKNIVNEKYQNKQ